MFVRKVLIFCLLWCAVFCTEKKFMGGALFFDVTGWSSNGYDVSVMALLGWKAGFGHCDSSCKLKATGWSQNASEVPEFSHSFSFLGEWTLETTFSVTNRTLENVTDYIVDHVRSEISLTNHEYGWEQETAFTSLYFSRNEPLVKTLRFSGSFWDEFDYNFIKNLTYVLSEKINLIKMGRFDNRSPLTLFQPLYRIPLNQVTTLRLPTLDLNGDIVHCELDSVNGPKPLPNIKVNRDCTVEVSTMVTDGFTDGGVGVVALTMQDFSSVPVNISFGAAPLSSVPVQFMVQTVKSLQDPIFVSPTFEDGHEFIVYEGSTLELSICAKPHPGSSLDIDSFNLRFFPDYRYNVTRIHRLPAQIDNSRVKERVRYAVYSLTFRDHHYASMGILGISILDKNGQIGIERHYTIQMREPHTVFEPRHDKPYFVFSPTKITCRQNSTCAFTLNSASTDINRTIANATVVYTSLQGDVNIGKHSERVDGKYFSTNIACTSSSTGDQILCVQVTDDLGLSSDPFCVAIDMIPKEPTTTTTGNTTTGSLQCSDAVDVDCHRVDNTAGICALSNNVAKTLCPDYCRLCNNENHVCSDSLFVDCHSLDKASKICSTRDPVATQYCPRYCKYCTVPSTLPPPSTTTVKPTICTTCTGFECLLSAKKVTCPLTTPFCLTVVENAQTGAVSFTKSCAEPSDCVVAGSGSSPHDSVCDNFNPMQRYYKDFSCRYCCSSDNCNGGGLTVPSKDTRVKIDPTNIIG